MAQKMQIINIMSRILIFGQVINKFDGFLIVGIFWNSIIFLLFFCNNRCNESTQVLNYEKVIRVFVLGQRVFVRNETVKLLPI
jgi:hypothetical protein